jgi:hypothetical protein
MPSIPIDILLLILDHVDKADLLTICLLNKTCCSCSQDILYRDIRIDGDSGNTPVIQTLAQSTYLAKRVHSFKITNYEKKAIKKLCDNPELWISFQNMTYLRSLHLDYFTGRFSALRRCTFKLASFCCRRFYFKPLRRFLISQPSLTDVELGILMDSGNFKFGPTVLPNLTRLATFSPWLPQLIPNRPVNEVIWEGSVLLVWRSVYEEEFVDEDYMDDEDSADLEDSPHVADDEDSVGEDSVDLSFFALSTTQIHKLQIDYTFIYPKPAQLLASIFPSLTRLSIHAAHDISNMWIVR